MAYRHEQISILLLMTVLIFFLVVFLFSFGFVKFDCSLLYFILRRREKFDEAEKAKEEAASKQADLGETTHM